ncbi:MAG: hypothetical protein V2A72_06270 [Candidatus Omnitrophota bacterium]
MIIFIKRLVKHRFALAAVFFALFMITAHCLLKFIPQDAGKVFCVFAYSKAINFQLYSLFIYTAVAGILIFIYRRPSFLQGSALMRIIFFCLVIFFVLLRVLSFQHGMYNNDHPDWGSFINHFYRFSTVCYNYFASNPRISFKLITDWLREMWAGSCATGVSGFYPFPSVLLGISGLCMYWLVSHTGYSPQPSVNTFLEFARFASPVFNILFAVLLITLARYYIFRDKKHWPYFVILFLLAMTPAHIFMGSAVTYNFLADALLVGCVLGVIDFAKKASLFADNYNMRNYESFSAEAARKFIAATALCGLLLGLLLATKWIFHSVIALLAFVVVALVFKYRVFIWKRKFFWHLTFIFQAVCILALAVALYVAFIYRSFCFDAAGFIGIFNSVVKGNFPQFSLSFGIMRRFDMLYNIILIPNIGYVNAVFGTLGLIIFLFLAIKNRSLEQIAGALWLLLVVAQTFSTQVMLNDHGAMTRNTLLIGVLICCSVYALWGIINFVDKFVKYRVGKVIKVLLVCVWCVEITLAGVSFVIFTTHYSPKYMTQQFISQSIPKDKKISVIRHPIYWWYPFYPQIMDRAQSDVDCNKAGERYSMLTDDEKTTSLVTGDNADYWIISSHDAYFAQEKDVDIERLRKVLVNRGYVKIRRFESAPFQNIDFVEKIYHFYINRLMSTAATAGVWSPFYFEVYERK